MPLKIRILSQLLGLDYVHDLNESHEDMIKINNNGYIPFKIYWWIKNINVITHIILTMMFLSTYWLAFIPHVWRFSLNFFLVYAAITNKKCEWIYKEEALYLFSQEKYMTY